MSIYIKENGGDYITFDINSGDYDKNIKKEIGHLFSLGDIDSFDIYNYSTLITYEMILEPYAEYNIIPNDKSIALNSLKEYNISEDDINMKLFYSLDGNKLHIIELLLRSGYIDINDEQNPCIDFKLCKNFYDKLSFLIDAGAMVTTEIIKKYIKCKDTEVFQLLLDNYRLVCDNVLFFYCSKSSYSLVDLLLYKIKDIDVIDSSGRTSLMISALELKYSMVKLLLKRGAKINLKDKDGNNAFHLLILNSNKLSTVKLCKVLDFLIKKGIDIRSKNKFNRSPADDICCDFTKDYLTNALK